MNSIVIMLSSAILAAGIVTTFAIFHYIVIINILGNSIFKSSNNHLILYICFICIPLDYLLSLCILTLTCTWSTECMKIRASSLLLFEGMSVIAAYAVTNCVAIF